MKRRQFLRTSAFGTTALSIAPMAFSTSLRAANPADVVWVENGEPEELLAAAMKALGGMGKFISRGDVVVIKPNIGWDRPPELAATTNPQLIAALVKSCKAAGAKEVKIFDRTCNNPRRCYRNSKIEKLAKEAGADVSHIRENRFKNIPINGQLIKEWPVYREYLEADKVINVPIAKHHSLSRVTLGLKNLMGALGGNRGSIHNNFSQKLAEIDRNILPTLTIIDAYRILIDNGPVGGNPEHVRLKKTLVASSCTVSADVTALELFGHTLDQVDHVKTALDMGLARFDIKKLNVQKIRLG